MNWKQLCQIEPRLVALYNDCKAETSTDNPNYCANRVWYRQYKPRLVKLVGMEAEITNYDLMGNDAYDMAYRKCYESMPNCRNCSCM